MQVMKAVSGKFHPIFQWFYFDSMESLPENLPLSADEVDLQVMCFALSINFYPGASNDCQQLLRTASVSNLHAHPAQKRA